MPFEPLPLTADTLTSLLNEGTERAGLDYKRRLNLNHTKDKVSIVKDLGAMQVDGGYIVIGADDNGQPSGQVTESEAKLFDQATVHSKVEGYLADGFDIRSRPPRRTTPGAVARARRLRSLQRQGPRPADGLHRRSRNPQEPLLQLLPPRTR